PERNSSDYRRPSFLVPHPQRVAVRARCGRFPVPPQYHHCVHVDRADAERREPELYRFLLPTQTSGRTPVRLLRDGGGGGGGCRGPGYHPYRFQKPQHPECGRRELDEELNTMQHLWLIPAFPLLGFLLNGALGRRRTNAFVNAIAIGSVLLSFAWVLKTLLALGDMETAYVERYGTWFQSGALRAGFDLSVDRLTAVMLLVVT